MSLTRQSKEFRLLVAATKSPAQIIFQLNAGAGAALNWALLLSLAQRHRVAGLVAANLLAVDSGDAETMIPKGVRSVLQEWRQKALLSEVRALAELKTVLRAFQDRGIEPLLLKGLSMSQSAFGELGLRHNRDIDLLVSEDEVEETQRLLGDIGFLRVEPTADAAASLVKKWREIKKDFVFMNARTGVIVEIHWRLFDNPHLGPKAGTGSKKIVLFDQVDCNMLTDSENFLYLCLHGGQHAWSRLKWLADLYWLMQKTPSADFDKFCKDAVSAGYGNAIGQTMILLRDLYDQELPAAGAETAKRSGARLLAFSAKFTMTRGEAREIEDLWLGSTLKNLGHYFLASKIQYLLAEVRDDIYEKLHFDARIG